MESRDPVNLIHFESNRFNHGRIHRIVPAFLALGFPAGNLIQNIKSVQHHAENAVSSVQMRQVLVADVKLRSCCVRIVVSSESDGTADIVQRILNPVLPEFSSEVKIAVYIDVIIRTPGLNHIPCLATKPEQTVIKPFFYTVAKACNRVRCVFRIKSDPDFSDISCFDYCFNQIVFS